MTGRPDGELHQHASAGPPRVKVLTTLPGAGEFTGQHPSYILAACMAPPHLKPFITSSPNHLAHWDAG